HIIFPDSLLIDTIPFSSTPYSTIILLAEILDKKSYQLIFDTVLETTLINSNIPSTKVSPDTIFFRDILYEFHSAYELMIDTLTLSKIKVIQKDSYHQRSINLDGIIGDDIIRQFVWKFDLYNRKVYVSKDFDNFNVDGMSVPFRRY